MPAEVRRPVVHEPPPALEQIRPGVRRLDLSPSGPRRRRPPWRGRRARRRPDPATGPSRESTSVSPRLVPVPPSGRSSSVTISVVVPRSLAGLDHDRLDAVVVLAGIAGRRVHGRREHPREGQSRRRPQRPEKRDVHQDAQQLRPGTRDRHDGVGARVDDPPPVVIQQHVEASSCGWTRSVPPAVSSRWTIADARARGGMSPPGSSRPQASAAAAAPGQQGDGGAAASLRRPADDPADRRRATHLGQSRRRVAQGLPLVDGVGIETGPQLPAAGGRQQQEQCGRAERLHHRVGGDRAQLLGLAVE